MSLSSTASFWSALGELPSLSDPLLTSSMAPAPVGDITEDNLRALKKWLRKQWDLPVLILVLDGTHSETQLSLVRYFREELNNQRTRLICFAAPALRHHLLSQLWSWRIQNVYSHEDLEPELLSYILHAEWQQHQADEHSRISRNSELELLTWLARMNRATFIGQEQLAELATLLTSLTHADRLLHLDKEATLLGMYPTNQALSSAWSEFAHNMSATPMNQEQLLVLQLQRDLPLHQMASRLCDHEITASIIIPVRCYQQIVGYYLLLLSESSVATLDVVRMSLLEKTMEQVRTQLERQQSENRLKNQYQRLRNTLSRLHQTQEQLYHAEKLSSIGQLAAGIAHEINNPVSYVMSNFGPLDEYIQTMSKLLTLHDQFIHAMNEGDAQMGNQLREAISNEREAADFEFMMEDIFSLVRDSRNGLMRVTDIVHNLRTFSRRDSLEMADINLCDCIRNAVKIMQYQLNGIAKTELDIPDSADIQGNEGMISQVLINLIQNAVHAVDAGGVLKISLIKKDTDWRLSVCDNGCGIPDDIRDKIFDPFFTTKDIGKGTGLGLSTSYSIMKRHHGRIEIESQPGAGTCFILFFPTQVLS
ncbi:sensor histidine kinase [Thalassolituus pacificus]|uniref:histidine kinase n=1 Tax=Thalassolituus pacificus TaxID=2975440 RepID=A0A9X3AFC8_9GAMM|nr:ATP-binding protein [Thalassolituus pacificus]MCT7357766.1 ATP-binding protein [Thalassolituus pacificus]